MDQSPVSEPVSRTHAWVRRLATLLAIVIYFEIGVFLLLFPWMDGWNNNWMADLVPFLSRVWDNGFFRGAVSGLGAINIYLSLLELVHMRR